LKLEKDFELAVKAGKSTSRRRKKDDEDIVSERFPGTFFSNRLSGGHHSAQLMHVFFTLAWMESIN